MKEVTKGHIVIIIVNLIFGINILIAKNVLNVHHINPYALSFYRMIGAAGVFWLASIFVPRQKIPFSDLKLIFFASLFGILINQFTFIVGLESTSPIDASIIVTLTPILTMILAALLLGEPITWLKTIGVLLGCSGALVLILSANNFHFDSHSRSWIGNLLCLISSISYAFYLTRFKDLICRYNPITLMKWMFLFATILILPFTYQDVRSTDISSFSLGLSLQILFVVVCATFVTYLLIPIGQARLRPTTLTMYNYMQPVITSFVSIFLATEVFGWYKALAAIMVFLGVYIVTQSKSKAQMEIEQKKKKDTHSQKE